MSPLPLESFVTRSVRWSYCGERMELALSQSLFSSNDVDRGSVLLLKSLAHVPLPPSAAVLDLGSGVGVLGIALARTHPGSRVWFQDRDALALAFTARNAAAASVVPEGIHGGLALQGLDGLSFDLIVSNIPAKAGEPVHADILRRMWRHLSPGGLVALVVVEPIAERIRLALDQAGFAASIVERGAAHSVFHARKADSDARAPATPASEDPLEPYLRRRGRFARSGFAYELATAYDLPEFDTLSYHTALAMETLEVAEPVAALERPILVWNPGQGHPPAYLLARRRRLGRPAPSLTLGGRDALALAVSARATAPAEPRCVHAWDPAECPGPFGAILLFPENEPHVDWESYLPGYLCEALEHGGIAVVSAGATCIARLLRHCHGLQLERSRKKSGARSVLLRRA